MKHFLTLLLSLSFAAAALAQVPTQTPIISQLFSFSCNSDYSSCPDGMDPALAPIQLADSNLYGVTWWGGQIQGYSGGGAVTAVTTSGTATVPYTFLPDKSGNYIDGENPVIGLTRGTDGSLYGVTESGGANNQGVMYKLTPSGTFQVLHNFCSAPNCADIGGPITLGKDGNFYGAQYETIFRLTPQGIWSLVHAVNPTTEGRVGGRLTLGRNGNFYGVTELGTACDSNKAIFRVTPSGKFKILHQFPEVTPVSDSLVQASDGYLYGATYASGPGTGIFRMSLACGFKIIQPGPNGFSPIQVLQASDGNLWILAHIVVDPRPDIILAVSTAGKILATATFDCVADGCSPSGMIQGSDGNFYGIAGAGGTSPGRNPMGTMFKVEAGLKPPPM